MDMEIGTRKPDALVLIADCIQEVGWRDLANQIIQVSTFHEWRFCYGEILAGMLRS
jgi:hypothetical protein